LKKRAKKLRNIAGIVLAAAVLHAGSGAYGDKQPADFVTWHTDNFFTQCDGNCAISVFGGPQLLTHQYDIFIHGKPAWDWRFGNSDLIGGAISRRLLTLWDSLDIEFEFGIAKRFGNMHAQENWLVLNFRWTHFPWNDYLRTSIAIAAGPSFAGQLRSNTHNATVLNYFSPVITLALPQYPQHELMVQTHHRSNIADIGKGGTPDPGWQYLTVGLRYRF
jgi:hypothetical protein